MHKAATKKASVYFFSKIQPVQTPPMSLYSILKRRSVLHYLNKTLDANWNIHSMGKWHKILCHCNIKENFKLENVGKEITITNKRIVDRETCILDKMSQKSNRSSDERSKYLLELIHCDIAGLIKSIVKDGFKYVHSFVNYSRINLAYFF